MMKISLDLDLSLYITVEIDKKCHIMQIIEDC